MGTEVVPVRGCPVCHATLTRFSWHEEPLLRGGGYGMARVTTKELCAFCGYEITRSVRSVRPDRRAVRV